MSIKSMMVDNVTIVTPVKTTDSRGATVKLWANATRVTVKGWMAQTNASKPEDELVPNREGTRSFWRLFIPIGSTLDNSCRIEYLGDSYEVVGRVHTAKTTLGPHHLEVPLRLVEG